MVLELNEPRTLLRLLKNRNAANYHFAQLIIMNKLTNVKNQIVM